MKIVVIGGTGLIGSKLVTKLGEHGHDAVAASPNTTQFFEFVPAIADAATADSTVRLAHVFFQPMAGDDVAQAVGDGAILGETHYADWIGHPSRKH